VTARAVAVYLSDHGFGHASRTSAILEHWLAVDPDLVLHVRTTVPRRLLPAGDGRVLVRHGTTDFGLVQPDCLTIDFAATIARLDELEASFDERVRVEAKWLRETGARLVVGDIPPLAFAAAESAGLPSVAVGNFSWDWIYEHYVDRDPRFAVHARHAAARYRRARLLLRLPFHGDMPAFSSIVDLPILTLRREISVTEARRVLGLPAEGPIVLFSFGGIGFPGLDARRLGEMSRIRFVTTDRLIDPPPNVITVDAGAIDYTTLLAACDGVVSKPGYGIVAACLARGLRLLCAWREDFPEAPILVRALEEHGTAAFVSVEKLAHAAFAEELEALLSRPAAPSRLAANGAERAVELLSRELLR